MVHRALFDLQWGSWTGNSYHKSQTASWPSKASLIHKVCLPNGEIILPIISSHFISQSSFVSWPVSGLRRNGLLHFWLRFPGAILGDFLLAPVHIIQKITQQNDLLYLTQGSKTNDSVANWVLNQSPRSMVQYVIHEAIASLDQLDFQLVYQQWINCDIMLLPFLTFFSFSISEKNWVPIPTSCIELGTVSWSWRALQPLNHSASLNMVSMTPVQKPVKLNDHGPSIKGDVFSLYVTTGACISAEKGELMVWRTLINFNALDINI